MKWYDEYLCKVLQQVRVRRIRQTLSAELQDHLECQRQAYLDEGLSEAEARRRALRDMGDPLLVGGELDRAHRPRTPWAGLLAALALMIAGFALRFLFGASVSRVALLTLIVSAGLILLFGCTDYTGWLRAAIPLCVSWLACAAYRLSFIFFLTGFLRPDPLRWVYLLVPQVLAVTLPLLLAMLASRLRGGGGGAFVACLSLPATLLALTVAYRHTGFDPGPMSVMALLGFGVLALAVKEGFFTLRRQIAYAVIIIGALGCAALLVRLLIRELSVEQKYWNDVIFPLVRYARLVGRSRGFALVSASDAAGFINQAFDFYFLAGVIALCGYLPFVALALGIAVALAGLYRQFLRMENRMGRLIGLAGTATLTLQVLLHFLGCFAQLTQQLCLPLLSRGNVMIIMDAAIVGMLLSALRGASLPEGKLFSQGREPFPGVLRV